MGRDNAPSGIPPEQSLLLPFPVAFLHGLTLIMHFLTARQSEFDFRPACFIEVYRKWDERQSLTRDSALQLRDFPVLQQQLPQPLRLMVQSVAVAIFGNVAVDQPHLLALDLGIALGDRSLALAKRFDLGAGELDARLEPLLDEVVEASAPVFGDDLLLVERLRERLGHAEQLGV